MFILHSRVIDYLIEACMYSVLATKRNTKTNLQQENYGGTIGD
jgi:hypothetical protein